MTIHKEIIAKLPPTTMATTTTTAKKQQQKIATNAMENDFNN